MSLNTQDIQTIRIVFKEEISGVENRLGKEISGVKIELRKEISGVENRLGKEISGVKTNLQKEIQESRLEMRQLFKQQGEQLSKAIADAVKLMAESNPTKEEFQEALDRIDELEQRISRLEHGQHTT